MAGLFKIYQCAAQNGPVRVTVRVEHGKTLIVCDAEQPIVVAEGEAVGISVSAISKAPVPLLLDVDRL